jgi:hypothetical protein
MSVPTYFSQMRDEKRTILVDFQHEDIILEIWKHKRQEAGEGIDNPPAIERNSSINFNSLKDARKGDYQGVTYWVI